MRSMTCSAAALLAIAAAIPFAALALHAAQAPAEPAAQGPEPAPHDTAYLGVHCEPLDFDSADLLMLDHGTGLNLLAVAPDSPAAAAGLMAGDVLLELDDQVLINPEQLAVLVRIRAAGDNVTLTVLRAGELIKMEARLVGVADLPPLGPGGRALDAAQDQPADPAPRRIDQDRPGGPRLAPDLPVDRLEIERRIREQQEMILRFIEEIEGGELGELGGPNLDLRDVERQIQRMIRQDGLAPGNRGRAHINLASNDGQHAIRINGDPNGDRQLHITDRAGKVLFDGELPQTGEQWQQVPAEARDKARQLLEMNNIRIQIGPAPAEPQAPQADDELPQA